MTRSPTCRVAGCLVVLVFCATCGAGEADPYTSEPADAVTLTDTGGDGATMGDPGQADVPCKPQCNGAQCGNDGCGGSCGSCSPDQLCQGGTCTALPVLCVEILPATIDFGTAGLGIEKTLPVMVRSCQDPDLEIRSLTLSADSSDTFSITFPDQEPSPSTPVILVNQQALYVDVHYKPEAIEVNGDQGTLKVTAAHVGGSDASTVEKTADVKGKASDLQLPEAVIKCLEGTEVPVQSILHLTGSQSVPGGGGDIVKFNWTVEQPDGSWFAFKPTDQFPDPQLEANVVGDYVLSLDVEDKTGLTPAQPAELTVKAVPDHALYVELVWDTPNDPEPYDEGPDAGADMDVHLAHPWADGGQDLHGDGKNDPWFDMEYDVFWFNVDPPWNSAAPGSQIDITQMRDDTDGWGPESLGGDNAGDGLEWALGVHYWDDHGFGPSTATLRVFVDGAKVFDQSMEMVKLDFWWAATIDWPGGAVTPKTDAQGQPMVTPNYTHPLFIF